MKENILKEKSYKFALRMIKLYKFMTVEHKEFVLSKQVLRSGTSIGANIEESIHAQSKSDFVHKLSIAQKEASETNYWLRLLRDSDYINDKLAGSMINDCEEVQKLLTASIKTAKSNL
ncbi:MAG: four helix bundle protein [Pyrinomonadaceae bacterium]